MAIPFNTKKPVKISPELAAFVGDDYISVYEIMTTITNYLIKNNLDDEHMYDSLFNFINERDRAFYALFNFGPINDKSVAKMVYNNVVRYQPTVMKNV